MVANRNSGHIESTSNTDKTLIIATVNVVECEISAHLPHTCQTTDLIIFGYLVVQDSRTKLY